MGIDPIATARTLVGTPFRLHGRDSVSGVDCVGLVSLAFGRPGEAPSGYTMRGGEGAAFETLLRTLRCKRRRVAPKRRDVFLLASGPAQFHLGIWTGDSLIHADAGLRRVVETPGWPRWPLLSAWIVGRKR